MFDNTNNYELIIEKKEGEILYFAKFQDGYRNNLVTQISREVAKVMFSDFVKKERNLRRWDERHTEQSHLTEKTLNERTLYPSESLEDEVFKKIFSEQLHIAILKLPELQRKRVYLYYFEKLTLSEIATIEHCSFQTVARGISKAENNLKKYL